MTEPMKTAGVLAAFDGYLPSLINWAYFLIASDEIEKAEWLLTEGLPGYYRDHPPVQVTELKQKMYKFLMDVSDYATTPDDINLCSLERGIANVNGLIRGHLIQEEVKAYNARGITPHIFEMGPGEYWLPVGLKGLNYKFTYQASFLSKLAFDKAKKLFEDCLVDKAPEGVPQIYVACEIIEHLRSATEITHCAMKHGISPDSVHLSTPLYTFAEGCPNWESDMHLGRGGHLRTYTPNEFMTIAGKLFPDYDFLYYPAAVQSIVGKKRGSPWLESTTSKA